MEIDFKKIFKETPDFLKILGFKNAYIREQENIWVLEFMPSKALTHSNGTIIQGFLHLCMFLYMFNLHSHMLVVIVVHMFLVFLF